MDEVGHSAAHYSSHKIESREHKDVGHKSAVASVQECVGTRGAGQGRSLASDHSSSISPSPYRGLPLGRYAEWENHKKPKRRA